MDVQPANLQVLSYPHPALRARALPVDYTDGGIEEVASRMIDLMREEEGIGLAAPQVGLAWRLFVAEIPEGEDRSLDAEPPTATDGPMVYLNPKISRLEGELESYDEGCLSLPEISGEVRRPSIVTMEATSLRGEPLILRAGGMLARCFQHEIDHLDGVLIIDKMTPRSRMKNRSIIRELEKQAAPAR